MARLLGCAASISGSETTVRAAVIIVDLTNVTVIRPVRLLALRKGGRLLQHLLVNIDDVPALGFVVVKHVPGNRMVTLETAVPSTLLAAIRVRISLREASPSRPRFVLCKTASS